MAGLFQRGRFRAAVGLIAAYAIALQTLLAAFAPLPANAQDFGHLSVICFGSGGSAAPAADGDAPAQPSVKFHCVLCGSALAAAAIEPDPVVLPVARVVRLASYASAPSDAPLAPAPARSGPSRAPPLTL